MIDKNESLAKASKVLCLSEPYYGLFLMMLNKSWSNRVPTLGVSKNGINYQLIINERFWNNLLSNWQSGLLKHEALHIALFHVERWDEFADKKIANLSADLVVNQLINPKDLPGFEGTKEQFHTKWDPIAEKAAGDFKTGLITQAQYEVEVDKIPPRGVYIKDFSELKLELNQGMKYYYDKLTEAKDKKDKSGSSGSKNLDDLLDQMENGDPVPCDHDWSEFVNMSEAEKKLLHSQTDYQLKETADAVVKSRGTIPGEIKDYIEGLNKKEPPKFDWKGYIRRFTGGSTKIYTKKLHRKYNKRFEDNPGLKIKQRKHILCAVDTSGSVSDYELKEFFHEIYHIHKTGTEVTVLQCDSAISNISPYKKGYEDKIKVYGRGGTDFQPIISYANEHANKYTCLIVATDGEAPAPEKCKLRTLWVHSSKSNINETLIGHKIKLN